MSLNKSYHIDEKHGLINHRSFEPDDYLGKDEESEDKLSYWQTVSTLLMSNIGISVLILPYSFSQSGLFFGAFVMGFVLFFGFYSIIIVEDIIFKLNVKIHTSADLGKVINPWFDHFFAFLIIVFLTSEASFYFFYFVEFTQRFICQYGDSHLCQNRSLIMNLGLILLVPLSLIPSIKSLNIMGFLKNSITLIIFFLSLIFSISFILSPEWSYRNIKLHDFKGVPIVFSLASHSIELVGIVYDVRNSMENKKDFNSALKVTFIISTLFTVILPITLYIAFQDNIKLIFLWNFPISTFVGFFSQFAYGFGLLLSYPIQLMPLYFIFTEYLMGNRFLMKDCDKDISCGYNRFLSLKYISLRIGVTVLIFSIVKILDNGLLILELMGSFVSVMIVFILPFSMYEYIFSQTSEHITRKHSKFLNYILILIGGIILVVNTYKVIFKSEKSH